VEVVLFILLIAVGVVVPAALVLAITIGFQVTVATNAVSATIGALLLREIIHGL
jgi:hypothetical protein